MSNSIAFYKMPAIAAYQIAVKEGDKALEKMATRKDVKAEVDYFRDNIQSVKSVEDLFKDRRMMKFILDATDLGKETDKMGLLKKVLTQKAEDSDALMNKLVDKRFKAAASLLQFGKKVLLRSSVILPRTTSLNFTSKTNTMPAWQRRIQAFLWRCT